MSKSFIEFVRKRDYIFVRELGQGACGKTVLLKDDIINELFVCKKYSPYDDRLKSELFDNFIREIKLLHNISHQNVVRIFNYHLYPDQKTGYIMMEYIDGVDISEYIKQNPDKISDIFAQAIKGFCHLESRLILHRDIRPLNLMVTTEDTLKIIDLGFGKRIEHAGDFEKSVSLNWWCDPPREFSDNTYDFSTEVYFVGKLFEKTIQELDIDNFEHKSVLRKMCQFDPQKRIPTFFDVEKEIYTNKISEAQFWGQELASYRAFANELTQHLVKIENGTKYFDDIEKIISKLESAYRTFMLEDTAPDAAPVLRCFLNGGFRYQKLGLDVKITRDFILLLKSSDEEKRRIILANIQSRLDAIDRYDTPKLKDYDDDIPF